VLGGLVAGEGCVRWTERQERFSNGSPRLRFVFELSSASPDRPLLEALATVIGAGSIQDRGQRRAGWLPVRARGLCRSHDHEVTGN
jgi:hypothetical protein